MLTLIKRNLNSLYRRFIYSNYDLTKSYLLKKFRSAARNGDYILLVYQMGKVGSTSIVNSLKTLHLGKTVFHVHGLSPELISYNDNIYRKKFNELRRIDPHLIESIYLREILDEVVDSHYWKIISLVRDPVARNISTLFQNRKLFYEFDKKVDQMPDNLLVQYYKNLFIESYEDQDYGQRHQTPLIWLDNEIEGVFGIDVYASDFPKDKGYRIYKKENVEMLLIRLENLNTCAADAIREFLGIENFKLESGNISENKDYGDAYKKFLAAIDIPQSYLDEMYNSRYARHFYSSEEIASFRKMWARTGVRYSLSSDIRGSITG